VDPHRFDTLTRSLSSRPSRRGALAALLGGTLGLVGLAETAAKKGKSKSKGKKKDKGKGTPSQSPGSPPSGGCTDVDCGGSCPRCPNGRSCRGRGDCASAFCANGTCQTCSTDANCGSDVNGKCYCFAPDTGGPKVCFSETFVSFASCGSCGPGTTCLAIGATEFACFKPCGAT
jgi:hypothetical protein